MRPARFLVPTRVVPLETWAQLVARISDVLAILLPFVLVWEQKDRGIRRGTLAAAFFLSIPQLFVLALDPAQQLLFRGGLRDWVVLGLLLGLLYSLLLYGLRLACSWTLRARRSVLQRRRRYRKGDGSWALPDDLPTARIVERPQRPALSH